MKSFILSFFISISVLAPGLAVADLSFKNHGKPVQVFSSAQLTESTKSVQVKILEMHELEQRSYEAYPFNQLLSHVYGDAWKNAEEILFTCADGYQSSIPVEKFKEFSAYLAIKAVGRDEFTLINKLQKDELVQLGPYYLIWDNLKAPQLQEGGASDFPYQVVGVDLINFRDRFTHMAPPKGAGKKVEKGFLAFRKYCANCHMINGQGGEKSIELNYPVSVTEMIKTEYLRIWIDKPTEIRWNTHMPPLNPQLSNRKETIDQIIAYLSAMAKHKHAPVAPKK